MSEAVLRLALADDQALVRKGLRALLESLGGLDVVIEAADGAALLAALQTTQVDVILSDIRMPVHSGIEVVKLLRARGDYTPVVLLTTFDDPGLMQGAISAGAQGYLLKDAEPEALAAAIRAVAAGRSLVSPQSLDAARRVAVQDDAKPVRLTERELAVLRLVAGGYSNKEIGRALNISDGTVKNHLTEILARLDARDRTHAVLKAIAARLL
ncbi:response regulator transcription factor [uncultured Nevskia sp.]|uniref:response regulator n=1 Tax=uncultured Nevskia sp. TaxID=228950 RepID=UPI0025E556FA|nr:response regulator transcription factor [uncultured Nevskia sp.]